MTGARFKLYQDSNNNGKYDAGIGDAYVGSGKISRSNYFLFTQIFAGASAEAYGYADYTADFFVGGNPVGVANWF